MAVTVWLSRDRVFDRMTGAERTQVMDWLAQAAGRVLAGEAPPYDG